MPKNIVVCCDGTWNTPDFRVGTNVWKFYLYLEENSATQVKYYDTGVGTQGFIDKITGGLSGEGLVDNIFEAYRFVCSHYEEGDNLFILGFSRGAYTARALAGAINSAGVLKGDFTCTEDHYKNHYHNCFDVQMITEWNDDYDMTIVCDHCKALFETVNKVKDIFRQHKKEVYNRFKQHKKEHDGTNFAVDPDELKTKILTEFPGLTAMKAKIKMIGVWDTVSALGIPSLADVIMTRESLSRRILNSLSNFVFKSSRKQYAFINDQLTPIVEYGYHALAVDEQRNIFKPVLWNTTGENKNIEQQWFIGSHSNVGGGYEDHTLSDIPLIWMLSKAEGLGLKFDTDYKKYVHPNHLGLHRRSHRESVFRFLPSGRRFLPANKMVHDSVYKRMTMGYHYSPENIFK